MARGPFCAVTRVTLPLCWPNMLCGAIFVFIFSIINVGVPDILRVRVYPLEVFIQFSAFFSTWNAVLLSLPMMAVTVLVILGLQFFMGHRFLCANRKPGKNTIAFSLKKIRSDLDFFMCRTVAVCRCLTCYNIAF